jgi:flavin-binding protein dodecin
VAVTGKEGTEMSIDEAIDNVVHAVDALALARVLRMENQVDERGALRFALAELVSAVMIAGEPSYTQVGRAVVLADFAEDLELNQKRETEGR